MIVIYILIALIIVFLAVTNLPVFGRLPRGFRLDKIQHLSNYSKGALQNLSLTPMQPEGVSFFTILKEFLTNRDPARIPQHSLKTLVPDLDSKPGLSATEIIWFGHSSYLIKINGYRILVDPIFSKTPSPFSFIGSKAFPGTDFVHAKDFKDIDVLLITHDHYDHLDYQSILQIAPNVPNIVTSLGVGAHLERWGIASQKIKELCWHDEIEVLNGLKLTALPARHFTGRKFKRNQTLWSAFALKSGDAKLFIGGDSGYDTHFKEIGLKHGPFDLAILECGQYNEYWPFIHMFPEQTVQAAIDLKADVLMPVHWGKFSLAMHPWDEPIKRVSEAAEDKSVEITTPMLGETVKLKTTYPKVKWWLD